MPLFSALLLKNDLVYIKCEKGCYEYHLNNFLTVNFYKRRISGLVQKV